MARRKFRNTQRYEPQTEQRTAQEFFLSTPLPQISRTELLRLIRGGEDTYLELKVQLSNSEKITNGICALANTGGGFMVFGVDDQLRVKGLEDLQGVQQELVHICREEIVPPLVPFIGSYSLDNGRTILALEVRARQRPYRTRDNRYYIRLGAEKREASPAELAALIDDARPLAYESLPAVGAVMDDIDEEALWRFIARIEGNSSDNFKSTRDAEYPATSEVLEALMLATSNRERGEVVVPTVAGLLLFGRDEAIAQLLPRADVTLTRYEGESVQTRIVEQQNIVGNMRTLYRQSLRFVERYVDLWDARPTKRPRAEDANATDAPPVRPRANYARRVVVESLVNALTHRDLAVRERPTQIHLFETSMEVSNARRSSNFSDRAARAIRFGIPQGINPLLAHVFTNPAYGASLASVAGDLRGLPMVLRESQAWSGRRAEIYLDNDKFRLKIYGA
jgi:ATP-dependent DNA helicase RecG